MHSDLLVQASQLARLDPNKPKQANLRRAVSSVYYALFHFLVQSTCRTQFGNHPGQAAYRQVLGRAFTHSVIRQACLSFSGGTLKATVAKGLPSAFSIPAEVRTIAATFVEAQDQRNVADYDLTARFKRSDVLRRIQEVKILIDEFDASPLTDERKFFLACLWAWKELSSR